MNMNIDSTVVATESTTMCNPPEHCQANTDENHLHAIIEQGDEHTIQ